MSILTAKSAKGLLLAHMRRKLTFIDWHSVAAFGLPFALYLSTLAPTIYNLDSAELTTATATGGIVRATGYPLYLMLGRVWSWLPVGDLGYRMNLFSAFNGALTVALAERILRRFRTRRWAVLGSLGLLATAPFFWALSLIAEVYTLHTTLMTSIILLLLRWASNPTPRRLALVGLALGLSAGNHAATALLVPGFAWYVLTVAPRQAVAPRAMFLAGTGLMVGLSVYLYLPLRYGTLPAFNYAGHYDTSGTFIPVNLHTPAGLWWLVSGRAFAGEMLAYSGNQLWQQVGHFVAQLWRAFFAVGVGPGLLGIAVTLRRDWRFGGMLLLMFMCSAGFYIDYRVADRDTMFLPAYLIWALWAGAGLQWLLQWVDREGNALNRTWAMRLMRSAIGTVVLLTVVLNWRLVDLSDDRSARVRGETILDLLEPNALILGWWDTVPVIEYLQLVEGQRPDVRAINRFLIAPGDMRLLIQREVARRPVYIDRAPTELLSITNPETAGPVFRLRTEQALTGP